MKIKLKCDRCGKEGTPEEIGTDYDDVDLCPACESARELEVMKANYADKLAWLESTALRELRSLKERIDAAESSGPNPAVEPPMKLDV